MADDIERERDERGAYKVFGPSTRAQLLSALRMAAPEYCSNRCPSAFSSGDKPRHLTECEAMRRLLAQCE